MPVTAEELRKLAESRKPRGTPTADELRALAESRKPKTEFKGFGFGVDPSQPQPKTQRQAPEINNLVDFAKYAWDCAGGPIFAAGGALSLQKDWADYESSKGKKGKPRPSDRNEELAQMGHAAFQGATIEQKTTMTDLFTRFVEDIPEQQWKLKATAQTLATFGGESLDPRWWLIGKAIAPLMKIGMAKAPAFMKKPVSQLLRKGVQKKGINLAKPFYKGLGKAETTHNLIIDDEIAGKLEGTFPGLTKKSGLTKALTGRKVTEKITADMFSNYYDDMTGLHNYKAFKKVSPYIEKYATRTGKPVTVMSIDGNSMKKLNTTFGEEMTDDVITQFNKFVQSYSQGQVAWFRPHETGDDLLGICTMTEKEAKGFLAKLNTAVQKTIFRVNTGQPVAEPLSFGGSVISSKAKPGAAVDMAGRSMDALLKYKRYIKWHKLDPNLKKNIIGEKPMLGGKVVKAELPKIIPPGSESTLRGTLYHTAVEKIGLSPDDLFNFNTKWGDKIYGIIDRGGTLDDIFDDIARLANEAGYTTKLKPMLKPKPVVKPQKGQKQAALDELAKRSIVKPKPVVKPKAHVGMKVKPSDRGNMGTITNIQGEDITVSFYNKKNHLHATRTFRVSQLKTMKGEQIKVDWPKELHGGIPIKAQIDRLDAFIYGKTQKATKWFWKKLKPLYKQTVQLSDEAVEAGMPRMLEVDKPWWGKMKSIFGTQAEQKKTIELINKAKTQLFKENREFIETNPILKKLFALTPEERHGIFAVGEGRAMPTKNITPRSIEVLKGLQDLGDQRARELMRLAKEFGLNIDGDLLVARKLQPLCVLTGKTPKEIVSEGIIDVDKLVYFRHYNPEHFKEWIGKFLKYPIRKWKSGFLKKSKGCWNYLDDVMSDPAITVPVQNAEMTEFKVRWRLINDIKEAIGKPIPKSGEMLPGYVRFEPKGKFRFYPVETKAGGTAVGVTTKGVEAFQIPSPAKTELDAFLGKAGAFDKFLNVTWDKATSLWKTSVLALSPRWVVYNTLGNTTLNALGDVSPKSYIRAIRTFHRAGQMVKNQGISFNEALSQQLVPDEVFTGFYSSETGSALRNLGIGRFHAQKKWEKIANFAGWLPNKVYKVNSRIESFYRTAHYLDKIYKGYPQEKAIKSVNEFLFNYTAMSWSERSIIRRIVPFYAWTKNISRLAMTYPIKHPVRVASMVLGGKAGTDYLRDNYGVRIDWLKGEVKIPAGDGVTYYVIRTRGANPFSDIITPFDLFSENGLTAMLSKVNPLIKVPIERATHTQIMPWGTKPFTAPVIKKDEWGREIRPLPSILRHIATQTPQYQLYENITKPYAKYTATGEMVIGKHGRVYPTNPILDILKMFGANFRTEEMSETQKREMQKEYNDKKYEIEKEIYKQRKEIVLENWEQLVEGAEQPQELQTTESMRPSTPTADELRALAESRR